MLMMAKAELRSERLRLRALVPEDANDVFLYASDPVVARYAGWRAHRTPFDSILYIQQCMSDQWGPITFAVEHCAEQRLIGIVDIRVVSRLWSAGEIGYTLARRYWGHGYNVEAGKLLVAYGFERLGLRRIQAVCDTRNRRSYRTMEKLGMVRERLLFGEQTRRGRQPDRFVYSLLRREWLAQCIKPAEPEQVAMAYPRQTLSRPALST